MTDITNDLRAEFARSAIAMYSLKKENRLHYDVPEDMATDLIADILHYIRAHDADPVYKMKVALSNFEADEAEEQKPKYKLELH